MFSFVTLATLALSAASAANAVVIPRATAPSDYRTDILESYDVYHARYMAIDCLSQHGTAFFDACCHPLKTGETLEKNRPAECNPANKVTSSAAQPSATDDEDCEDDDTTEVASSTPAPTTTTKSAAPTSSAPAVVNVAPDPSSEAAPTSSAAPTTKAAPTSSASPTKASSTQAPAKTTKTSSAAAAPTSASNNEVNSGGFATFFFQNGVAGACGKVHSDSDFIAAIDEARYGNSGAQSDLCGKQVKITNPANGKSVTVTIADDCPTCTNSNSIDLSVGAFTQIATEEQGMVGITWSFV